MRRALARCLDKHDRETLDLACCGRNKKQKPVRIVGTKSWYPSALVAHTH